jgi:hypothetical protein
MMDFIAYSDGTNDLLSICDRIGIPYWETDAFLPALLEAGVIVAAD